MLQEVEGSGGDEVMIGREEEDDGGGHGSHTL